MTNIAFILPAPNGGGAERAMIAVANRMAADGAQVDMLLVRREGPFLCDIAGSVRIIDLAAGNIRKALPALRRYMRAERPPLLISALVGTDVLALVGKALFRWPTHLHLSVQNAPVASAGVSQDALERRWPLIIRTLYRFADSLNGISIGVARDVEALMGKAQGGVPVINNPVDIARARARSAEAPAHSWLARKSGPVVLAVGRLVRQKDYPTLLRAFRIVRERRPGARLLILGEGQDRAEVEAEIHALGLADAVAMPGFDDNPFAAMAAADVFVLASRWEGFANVVAEALACGATVVSTDCPSGPGEILAGGEYGRLAPVGDAAALADAIGAALAEPADPDVSRRRAEEFSLDRVVAGYRALFAAHGLRV